MVLLSAGSASEKSIDNQGLISLSLPCAKGGRHRRN